jgi:hypothetical protein
LVRVNLSMNRAQVEELQDLGLVERSLQAAAGKEGGEVEESAGGGGDRDAVVVG